MFTSTVFIDRIPPGAICQKTSSSHLRDWLDIRLVDSEFIAFAEISRTPFLIDLIMVGFLFLFFYFSKNYSRMNKVQSVITAIIAPSFYAKIPRPAASSWISGLSLPRVLRTARAPLESSDLHPESVDCSAEGALEVHLQADYPRCE